MGGWERIAQTAEPTQVSTKKGILKITTTKGGKIGDGNIYFCASGAAGKMTRIVPCCRVKRKE